MSYYGSWKIDDLLTFAVNTHLGSTGAAIDADAVPDYRVYEGETATPILTGSMALLDSTNTEGFYTEELTLSAANGFENGKSYNIYISATVNSIEGTLTHNFQIAADVDANVVSLDTGAINAIRDGILPTQNVAFDNINFLFVATSDHVTPVTGATGMSVTRSIDSAPFGASTGTLAEVANGIYQYDASAADMNGGVITFRFRATGGTPGAPDDRFITIVTGGGV